MSTPRDTARPLDRFRLAARRPVDPLIPTPDLVETAAYHRPLGRLPRGKRAWLEVAVAGLSLLGLLVVLAFLANSAGAVATTRGAIAAFFPLVIVTGTLLWIDRWEPEPAWLLISAFLWGAGMATSLALVSNTSGQILLGRATTTPTDAEALTISVVAPFVEETLKALGVVILMLLRRRSINSPLDGIVIAGLVGAGFAFTENITYFLKAGDLLVATFVMRALASPFCHSMFTSMTGLALAMALTRLRGRRAWVWATPVGWATAVLLHALWNGLAAFASEIFLITYIVAWIPFFIAWIATIAAVAAKQRRWIQVGLKAFAEAGWIHESEIAMVCSLAHRRAERRRARAVSRSAKKAMVAFHNAAARLGLTYGASVRLGPSPTRTEATRADLGELVRARATYAAELQGSRS